MNFNKIGFVGLGLIGGSIAQKIKQNKPDTLIYATAGRESTIHTAFEMGIIENNHKLSLQEFDDFDLIFLCAPVQKNLEYLKELKSIIKKDCIITDVGSTKTEVHNEVILLELENNFIGGHPMTGSEKTGIENANPLLLENAYYIITPTSKTSDHEVSEFREFVSSLGSIPLVLDYKEHDYATASISHLPHMISFALTNLVKEIDTDDTMKTIAAGGFRDMTRIAASSPIMWQNICESNKEQLLKLMHLYSDAFNKLTELITSSDEKALLEYFQSAKDYRDSLFLPPKRSMEQFFEIYVDLEDVAGGIAIIASLLAYSGVSIKNIGIINNREFEEGVLRIEFYDNESLELATKVLEEKNYKIHQR